MQFPLLMVVPCVLSLVMLGGLQLFLGRTFVGRAIMAVAQDQQALRLLAVNPIKIKRIAFALSIATCSLAGTFLIVSSRSSRRSTVNTSAACSRSACSAASAACQER